MKQFQTELDIATIDFKHDLKAELNAYFNAVNASVVILDMATHGLISYYSHKLFKESNQAMTLVCENPISFNTLIQAPSDLYTYPPTQDFIEKTASFITKRFNSHIGIAIAEINDIEENNSKLFIGYSFYNNSCNRIIECSASEEIRYNQIINGVFGYLKMLFIKYPIINKRS